MTNSRRQQYGLGSFVKKFTRPIKKVLKSPLGKAALLGGLGWAANAGKIPGLGSGWMSNLSNPFGAAKKNWLRNMFLAKGADPGGKLSGGKLGLGALGLLAVGTPLWQKMMKTGPYQELEEETEDWDIQPASIANIMGQAKDYYRNYDPYTSSLNYMSPKEFVNPTFYSAKGGRAGHQRGGPAGGASAGGNYGGDSSGGDYSAGAGRSVAQGGQFGRSYDDRGRIDRGNTGVNIIRSEDMLPPPNLTPPSTVDRHRKLLTQNLYHKGDDEFDDQTVDYLGNKVDETWMDSIQSGVGKNPHLSVDQLAQIADDATMNRFSLDSLENQADKTWMGSIQSGLGKNPHLSVDQLAEIADDATMYDFSGMKGDVAEVLQKDIDASKMSGFKNQDYESYKNQQEMLGGTKVTPFEFKQLQKGKITEPGTYVGAQGGIVGLANGGGVAEAQAEQMLKMEYQKYRNQGGTMSYQQFKMQVLQQAQAQGQGQGPGQGPMAQGQQAPQMAATGGRMGYKDPAGLVDYDLDKLRSNLPNLDEVEITNPYISKDYSWLQKLLDDRKKSKYIKKKTQNKAEGGIMDLGGMEKDYRAEGGFVPIGGKEKADDVPARLSKNEFVFTADAVRNAGGGDIDAGAEVMENVMKNLEEGGQISEESQGAQGMYNQQQMLQSRMA